MCSKYAKNGPKIAPKTLLKIVIFPQNSSTIMSTTKQQFFGEIKMRFYLRSPYSTRPCMIFVGTNIGGKFYRASAQVKVYPSHWDSKRQLAVISNVQSIQDNRNNKIVNDQLSKLRRYFSEFIEYICNNDVDDIGETLKLFIYRDMAKKRKIDLKQVIAEALEYYHKYVKPSIKDSTKRQNESLLSEFGRFVDSLPEKDKTMQIFSQKGLNRYKKYLIDKMERSKTDDKMRNFGVGMLNRCGAIIALLINRVLVEKEDNINPVVWNKVDDPRREDQIGHIPLLDNEVAAIENCSGLTDVEEEYRNLFLLQLECGQRVSDVAKILTGKYKVEQGKKYKYIVLSTIKENIKAYVPMTPRMTMLLERVKAHKLVDPKVFEEKTKGKGNNTYNEAIRRIAKKADLDREIVKINASQTEVKKLLYETITSHDARCTFITNMIKKGVSPDRLCKMTGHASDEMIKRVYAQLSDADEINRIESDLYSDVDDDDAVLPENSSSDKLDAAYSVVPIETQIEALEATTSKDDTPDPTPAQHFDRNSYIKGLEEAVNSSLAQIESWYSVQGIDDSMEEMLESRLDVEYQGFKEQIEEEAPNSDEEIIKCWHEYEEFFNEEDSKQPESCQGFIDIIKITFLNALTNYCEEKQFGRDVFKRIDGFKNEIYEGNPMLSIMNKALSSKKILIPFLSVSAAAAAALQYAIYNRPVIGHLLKNEDFGTLIHILDWNLVYQELHKFPALRLEAMIQKTDCPNDIKVTLYKSIISGDIALFTNTIKSYDRETTEMIELAYVMDFINKMMAQGSHLLNPERELLNPLDEIADLQDFFASSNPFDEFEFGIFTLEACDNEEQAMSGLDSLLGMLEELKRIAYPLERNIYNKVLGLINQYPELKKAYEDFKAKQNAASGAEQPKEQVERSEDKKEEKPEEQKEQKTVQNYLPSRTNNINIDELIRLLTQKDKLNNNHIFVTLVKCDSSETDVAMCLKYFLDYKSSTLSFKLRWNDRNKVSLKFLIRLLFNTNGKANRKNVIDKNKYDGISESVSTGQGQGSIWPPVIEVFDNCPKSIEQAGLGGDEGSDTREYNLKQLRTIAKIYFACKK
jgi:integrase